MRLWRPQNPVAYGVPDPLAGTEGPLHSEENERKRDEEKTDLRQHLFSERIVNIWNTLDEETVSAPSVNSLKNRLHKL